MIVGYFPAVTQLKMKQDGEDKLEFDVDGNEYAYRGRGPVWSNNSCAFDCAVVLGKLLDAGSTVVDIDRNQLDWRERLTVPEHIFITATNANWDVYSDSQSIAIRDQFLTRLAQCVSAIEVSKPNAFWVIWTASQARLVNFTWRTRKSALGARAEQRLLPRPRSPAHLSLPHQNRKIRTAFACKSC